MHTQRDTRIQGLQALLEDAACSPLTHRALWLTPEEGYNISLMLLIQNIIKTRIIPNPAEAPR